MGTMPEKKTLTVQRVLALVIAYITLSVGAVEEDFQIHAAGRGLA